jgi:hypothetical protein
MKATRRLSSNAAHAATCKREKEIFPHRTMHDQRVRGRPILGSGIRRPTPSACLTFVLSSSKTYPGADGQIFAIQPTETSRHAISEQYSYLCAELDCFFSSSLKELSYSMYFAEYSKEKKKQRCI